MQYERPRGRALRSRVVQSLGSLLVVALCLAGCGVSLKQADWRAPAGGNWDKDSYECERDARDVAGTGGKETFGVAQDLAEKCLRARGYAKR